jgi:hypothetical protein
VLRWGYVPLEKMVEEPARVYTPASEAMLLRRLSLDLRGTAVGKLAAEVPQWFERLDFLGLPKGAVGLFGRMAMPRRVKLALGDPGEG